jgi:hypothetical protein
VVGLGVALVGMYVGLGLAGRRRRAARRAP